MYCTHSLTHSLRLLPRWRGDGTSNSGVDLPRVRSRAMLEASVNVVRGCFRSFFAEDVTPSRARGSTGLDHPAGLPSGMAGTTTYNMPENLENMQSFQSSPGGGPTVTDQHGIHGTRT